MEIHIDKTVQEFIQLLEKSTIAKVLRMIELLETFGHRLGMPHSKKITTNLFELRVRGAQETRILYTFHKRGIVLLHGFVKKTSKIPRKEIEMARAKLTTLDRI